MALVYGGIQGIVGQSTLAEIKCLYLSVRQRYFVTGE
jgi:hypothetical protein